MKASAWEQDEDGSWSRLAAGDVDPAVTVWRGADGDVRAVVGTTLSRRRYATIGQAKAHVDGVLAELGYELEP